MSVRIARLKNGEDVIADIQEICPKDAPEKPVAYLFGNCLLYTSPSPRDQRGSRMPSSA